jgi:hypothetical protein
VTPEDVTQQLLHPVLAQLLLLLLPLAQLPSYFYNRLGCCCIESNTFQVTI